MVCEVLRGHRASPIFLCSVYCLLQLVWTLPGRKGGTGLPVRWKALACLLKQRLHWTLGCLLIPGIQSKLRLKSNSRPSCVTVSLFLIEMLKNGILQLIGICFLCSNAEIQQLLKHICSLRHLAKDSSAEGAWYLFAEIREPSESVVSQSLLQVLSLQKHNNSSRRLTHSSRSTARMQLC